MSRAPRRAPITNSQLALAVGAAALLALVLFSVRVSLSKEQLALVAFVPSPASFADRRHLLRVQFARNGVLTHHRARLLFVLSSSVAADVAAEATKHNDIVFVDCADMDDGNPVEDSSTTCKVIKALAIIDARFDAPFVARVGDDAYFRWDAFLDKLAPTLPKGVPLYIGRFLHDSHVYENDIAGYLGVSSFPDYASGMGYVFTADVVRYLVAASRLELKLKVGYPEDAMVGLWLLPMRVVRVNTDTFHDRAERYEHFMARPCTADSMLIHYMTPVEWARITPDGLLVC